MPRYSEQTDFSREDLDNILDMFEDVKDIVEDSALMKLLERRAKQKLGELEEFTSIRTLRDKYDSMVTSPTTMFGGNNKKKGKK